MAKMGAMNRPRDLHKMCGGSNGDADGGRMGEKFGSFTFVWKLLN